MAGVREYMDKELSKWNNKYDSPSLYTPRELSWMEFNKRVLHQATRSDIPLLEKLKFLSITDSNLDEFIMVRFSSIINRMNNIYSNGVDISGLTADEEYKLVLDEIMKFKNLQEEVYASLKGKLKKNNINICKFKELNSEDKEEVESIFMQKIYPLLTPVTYDTTKDLPLLRSKHLNIVVSLEDSMNANLNVISIIPIDSKHLDRIFRLSSSKEGDDKYILLEDIIMQFLDKIFNNKKILYKGMMKLLRESDIEIEHDIDVFIIDRMKKTLIEREFSRPIFMSVDNNMPKNILKIFTKIYDINKSHVFKSSSIMDYTLFVSKPIRNDILEYDKFTPQYPQELIGETDMFSAIDTNDIVLHHPYETFIPVIKFLENAADDPDVLAIRQTLYRVSSIDSPIIDALCKAAKNGKQVSILIEIKARFDEEQNISLIEKLKLSGCNLIYGSEDLKTHCKFILIAKKINGGIRLYSHIGTGNYNDKTARIYTDISYFTSKRKIGEDLLSIFNILSGFSEPSEEGHRILFSPYNLRTHIYDLIDREIENASKGKDAAIILKLNSISDKGIIRKLYEASDKGVKVYIICRGICSVKKINKNISVRSVIGQYLEHSRIYYFHNNGKSDIFISSADMLTRNLDKRIELLVPINNNQCELKLKNILDKYFLDTFNTYRLNSDNEYKFLLSKKDKSFNIHQYFMDEAISSFKLRNIPKMSLKK